MRFLTGMDVSGARAARLMTATRVAMASPRSAGQTADERTNVFLLRCAEILNRRQEERPVNISLPGQLWMNQSLGGQCVFVCDCVLVDILDEESTKPCAVPQAVKPQCSCNKTSPHFEQARSGSRCARSLA